MTDPNPPVYVPQVGDTVRHPRWTTGTVKVLYVGDTHFFGLADDGDGEEVTEGCWALNYEPCGFVPWERVEPTPADHYLTFASTGELSAVHPTERAANEWCRFSDSDRVARFTFAEWVEASS